MPPPRTVCTVCFVLVWFCSTLAFTFADTSTRSGERGQGVSQASPFGHGSLALTPTSPVHSLRPVIVSSLLALPRLVSSRLISSHLVSVNFGWFCLVWSGLVWSGMLFPWRRSALSIDRPPAAQSQVTTSSRSLLLRRQHSHRSCTTQKKLPVAHTLTKRNRLLPTLCSSPSASNRSEQPQRALNRACRHRSPSCTGLRRSRSCPRGTRQGQCHPPPGHPCRP
mmetsp:Transcript_31363/g.72497  ORF Transcript_31363/g.72497 Transcript_31363/m.72497 type:complete len:223 (-) Transcript_31363:208-876(-)